MAIRFSTKLTWIFALLLILVMMIQVGAQPPPGFINIDCGWKNSSAYVDQALGIRYSFDDEFVEGGQNHEMSQEFMADPSNEQQKTLRSFPDGLRNCYTLPSTIGKKYLLRATFTYGNYDGLNKTRDGSLFLFGLHIGVNFWATVNLSNWNPSDTVWKEVITVARSNNLSVCLINFGSGIPFISSLELRPLEDTMYPFVNTSVSVSYFQRFRFGNVMNAKDFITRYPTDPYDRWWQSWSQSGIDYSYPWLSSNTSNNLASLPGNSVFNVPSEILQNASTLEANKSFITINVASGPNKDAKSLQLLPIFHFTEVNESNPNRRFDIYSGSDYSLFPGFSPSRLRIDSLYQSGQFRHMGDLFFTLNKTPSSSLPPLINALEVYSLVRMENLITDSDDGTCSNQKRNTRHTYTHTLDTSRRTPVLEKVQKGPQGAKNCSETPQRPLAQHPNLPAVPIPGAAAAPPKRKKTGAPRSQGLTELDSSQAALITARSIRHSAGIEQLFERTSAEEHLRAAAAPASPPTSDGGGIRGLHRPSTNTTPSQPSASSRRRPTPTPTSIHHHGDEEGEEKEPRRSKLPGNRAYYKSFHQIHLPSPPSTMKDHHGRRPAASRRSSHTPGRNS